MGKQPPAKAIVRPKPTKADLLAAMDQKVPDLIAPGLSVLFCGINPGLYSAYTHHHFARPGNRFWPALFASGFTHRLLRADEEHELLASGYGITNMVERATLHAADLTRDELIAGAKILRRKLQRYRPRWLGILGVSAFRVAFASPEAVVGPQSQKIADTSVWVLPNPSGLNAHFTPKVLAEVFRKFREAAGVRTA
ncbi:MAG TPA: G/U mismatch-specific DNA glycosylase [Candidatus Dormibacteraeota bacterium]|nr:G/U mismatch-specific DNA glycosylase [Candidatus Dormibacteraeota bacterium]